MPTAETMIDQCESLWRSFTDGHKAETSVEDKRERDEDYVTGFRNVNQSWTIHHGGYTVVATRTNWTTMNPGADANGTKRKIEISEGKEIVFRAVQEDDALRKIFGAGERYVGSQTIPGKSWTIEQGEIPSSLAESL